MKVYRKFVILALLAGALGMIGILAKPLGIPPAFDIIPTLISLVFIGLGFREFKKAKAAGQFPMLSDSQKRKRLAWIAATLAVTCLAGPFLTPYTVRGELPFGLRAAASAVVFVVGIGIVWFSMKRMT